MAKVQQDQTKALARAPGGGAVVAAELASLFAQEAGAGLENVTAKDMAIPFIALLQDLSPQTKSRDAKYIDGAEAGMFFNTVTNQLFDGAAGAEFIPVDFTKVYNEWRPRASGGGFVASHATEQEAEFNKAAPENEVHDTANHFVLIRDTRGGDWTWGVLSMTKTKLKVSRNLLANLSMLQVEVAPGQKITPPSYGTRWLLTTVEQKNEKGTFFNFKAEYQGLVADVQLFQEAKRFREALKAGEAKVDFNKAVDADLEGGDKEEF